MESRKCSSSSSKIRDIVRLQQVLKKWRKQAAVVADNNNPNKQQETITTSSKASKKSGMKFLKKTLSFSDACSSTEERHHHQQQQWGSNIEGGAVPRGCLAVCVGRAEKRFVIPTRYLGHGLFAILLREAEEEFGFQNEGVLRIPCEVAVFEQVLRFMKLRHETDLDPTCKHSSSSSSNYTDSCYHHYYCSHMCT